MLNDEVILISPTTASTGKKFIERILTSYKPRKLILFGKDELTLAKMAMDFDRNHYPSLHYLVGDFNNRSILYRALEGVDIVLLGAIAKQTSEAYNAIYSMDGNLSGLMNLVDAAIDQRVDKVIYISNSSTYCTNGVGNAAWLCCDKLITASNCYSGQGGTRFSVIRLASIIRHWDTLVAEFGQDAETHSPHILDSSMTLFWITPDQSIDFILLCLERMFGGEVFIPKLPSVGLKELFKCFPSAKIMQIFRRESCGELHEVLLSEEESNFAFEYEKFYSILPFFIEKSRYVLLGPSEGEPLPLDFSYRSEKNTKWLSTAELENMMRLVKDKKSF